MKKMIFKSSIYSDTLEIEGNMIKVTNKFGDTYTGSMDAFGKITTKSKLGLGYILRAMTEFRDQVASVNQ